MIVAALKILFAIYKQEAQKRHRVEIDLYQKASTRRSNA